MQLLAEIGANLGRDVGQWRSVAQVLMTLEQCQQRQLSGISPRILGDENAALPRSGNRALWSSLAVRDDLKRG